MSVSQRANMRHSFFVAVLKRAMAGVGSRLHHASLFKIWSFFCLINNVCCVCKDKVKEEQHSERNTPQLVSVLCSSLESNMIFRARGVFSADLEGSNF